VRFIRVRNKTKVVLHCINSMRQLRDPGVNAARRALFESFRNFSRLAVKQNPVSEHRHQHRSLQQ